MLGSLVMETPQAPTPAPGKVGPSSWAGDGNPLTQPGAEVVRRGPGRPRKEAGIPPTTTVAGTGTAAPEAPQGPAEALPVVKRRRRNKPIPEADREMIFSDELPEGLSPYRSRPVDLTRVRLIELQEEHQGKWARMRVFASKSGASDVARELERLNGKDMDGEGNIKVSRYADAFYGNGKMDARVITTENGFELWARYTESPL